MTPQTDVVLTLPRILQSSSRFNRWHNKAVKDCLKEEMIKHWRVRVPDHFRQSARAKYRHKPRSRKYQRWKSRRHRSRRDLVKTQVTEQKFTSRYDRIRAGGRATDGRVSVTLVLKWPFPTGKQPPDVKVTPHVMASEIEATTRGQEQAIYNGFRDRYLRKMQTELTNRQRRGVRVSFV